MNDVLEAALRYAAAGIYVFPTHLYVRGDGRKGVKPIADWDTASSTDPEVITGWFSSGDAALCIDCGKSGIAGVDQDVTEGKNGLLEWEKLNPTPTWRVRSPTGGAHDYYRADPDHLFTVDNVGTVADGVDVRGVGGFLFAPPSIDPRGGSWEWVAGEPDWENLPPVPAVVIERMEAKAESRRPKASPPVSGEVMPRESAPPAASQLFGSPSAVRDYGPGGGFKRRTEAGRLLSEKLEEFRSRTTEGSARSHFLAQELGVLAGHGVGVFWTYEEALDALMGAALENGFADTNGYAYAEGQARRGLDYGMNEPWVEIPEVDAEVVPEIDEVDALLAEMRTGDQIKLTPPPRMLIQGLLTLDSESWLIGAPGSKKSFVALDMAAHVAGGQEWMKRKVSSGPVVMIVAEGAGGMGARILAWEKQQERPFPPNVYILPRPVQASNAGAWAVLREACRRLEAVLVVIDTQARVTVGLEENSAKEMGVYVEAVRSIREATGGCVLTVHHTGRAGGDARGSSAIDGAQTTELKVACEAGSLKGKLVSEKQKDLQLAGDVELAFVRHVVGVDEDGQEISSLALAHSPFAALAGVQEDKREDWEVHHPGVQAQIIKVLRDQGVGQGMTKAEVRQSVADRWYGGQRGRKVGLRDSTFTTAWNTVLADGVAVNVRGERWALDEIALETSD